MWSRGMTRTWVGARGAMSRIAMTVSSSATRVDGISPATIRQKRQAGSRRGAPFGAHQRAGFVLIRKPMVPTSPAMTYEM